MRNPYHGYFTMNTSIIVLNLIIKISLIPKDVYNTMNYFSARVKKKVSFLLWTLVCIVKDSPLLC
jgi:hypothetical protein